MSIAQIHPENAAESAFSRLRAFSRIAWNLWPALFNADNSSLFPNTSI
jgi:hypothetical protein